MADDVLQFVDSVSATAAVRLDMNDATTWGTRLDTFDFSPPPLRQARAGTLLVDGDQIPASSYGNRILHGTFEVIKASIDLDATQIQLLNRELDRDSNYLKWQPNGATSPVFFRTLRSPIKRVTEQPGSGLYKTLDFEIEAEPFALGLREDVGAVTVNNDPAAGANGLFLDVSSVKGDVATPAMIRGTSSIWGLNPVQRASVSVRQHGTPSDLLHFVQAESMTSVIADTTNPGGGPDATMSGTGTNNFMRTTFATSAAMSVRLKWPAAPLTIAQTIALRGAYRVFAVVRGVGVSTVTVSAAWNDVAASAGVVAVPIGSAAAVLDLGLINIGKGATDSPGRYSATAPLVIPTTHGAANPGLSLSAGRTAGADPIDWDYVFLAPADESLLLFSMLTETVAGSPILIDGNAEQVYRINNVGSPYDGTGSIDDTAPISVVGGFPVLKPGQTNRVYLQLWRNSGLIDKTVTAALTVSYWPRYLYIRPAAT